MSTLGRNIAFPIYKGDGTSFHNLVIKKSTSDSIVMSLGDKVTGDVYYKDNTLECNMDEYILVDGVKYSIVNPPTIVREGLKSENGDLKGMTKYSFEFYHPMYMLGNMAFSDVAVTNAESMFKSHDRTFSWIGNLTDYVAKLNKNLQDTQFIVSISSSIDADSRKVLSDVLSFTNNTIADALKTAYDTWHFPFVVDAIKSGEQYYNQGKRFLIQFGNPTREILDANDQPFVFHFGKGVGLKNNSRTPRNNKIVTRVAGYGSEQNIPYGYPQIPWTGDPSATQTADGYPIYEGIVGGVVTKLVKHPFTRTHLMPSVYAESVRKKVDSAASDYDNTTPLVDYYDAPSTYPNPINLNAPKLDIVGFDDIKPELGDMAIVGAVPVNDDLTPASGWDDTMDDDGNYHQSYFKVTLPQLDFDIYATASITEEMKLNMRSGACIGCTFDVQVDWDDYKKNFFDAQGNFLPNGSQRDLTKYPKSNLGSITVVCKKDLNTYGMLMPNVYQQPSQGDKFVILGISLPSTYITNAQERLDDALMTHMLDNNVYYYDYPLNFDEDFFYNHTDILSQVRPNSVLRFTFGDEEKSLYIKQITIKYGEGVLPKYDITLTDNIEVVLNQIGLVADDVSRLALAMMQMNKRTNINISNTESLQKYVDYTIMPNLESIQKQIDGSQVTYFGNEDPFDASHPYSDGKYVVDPTKFPASEWDDDYSEHDGDMFYNRDTGKGYEFTIIDNLSSPVVYGWQLIQDEDIVQALNNAQTAQDTADGKRRVFICDASHHTPNPPYDVGDLWVNVKYPYSTGATYDDEILKCVVAKTEGQSFSIDDWSLANGYTAALRNFINGTYADDLEDIQNQIDGKAETWYQNTDPSTAWTTTALKNQHKGDIWHNSSNATINGVKAGQDAIWNGTAWVVDETVPQSVYDEIDGKCAIYVTWGAWGNDLQEKDLFIPSSNTTQGGVTYKANKVYRCVDKDTPLFQEIAYTDDTQYNGFITKLIGSSGQTKDAAENAIAAIKHALNEGNTYNEGGLILSNLISLGTGNPTSGTFTPWAGISGIYKTSETGTGYKGHGIAAWYGGGMVDGEVSQSATNAAKSLFRFDGSGYVAGGNLSWDKNGNVTIQGYSINATTLKVGGVNVATQAMLDNYVSKAFFNRLFTAYDANGNAIVPNDTTTAVSNLKLLVGTWTEQYLSALGLNSQGGGGTGDVSHIKIGTNPDVYLDPIDGIIDMSSYAANWNDAYQKRHTHSNKSVLDGITSTKVSHWDAVYGVVPAAAYESGNQLADKNFVNSSIATATATYISNNNGEPFNSLAELQAYTGQHDKNDYAFVKTTDSAGNTLYNRYKFDGTSWALEYTLNNSSFTSDQWSAINSGITSAIVSTIVPNTRSITAGTGLTGGGNLQADRTISLATSGVSAGTYRSVTVDVYGRVTAGTNPTTLSGYGITDAKIASGVITLGSNTITPITSISKNSEGILSVVKGTTTDYIDLSHNHSYWEILDRPTDLEGFGLVDELNTNYVTIATNQTITGIKTFSAQVTANGLMLSTTKKIYFGDSSHYIELDSTGFHFSHGIYSDSFVSALGANSSGGGGGDFSEEQMWAALQSNTGTYANEKINANHIPDTSSLYGYLKASSLNGYATQSWVNSRGFLTSHQNIYALTLKADGTAVTTFTPNSADASLDFVAGANVSLTRGTNKITIANTYSYTLPLAASGTRGGVQIGYSESGKNYAVKLSGEKMYVSVPWTDTTYESKAAASGGTAVSLVTTGEKYTWNAKQEAISDLSTIRSNASNGNTAYGYFTNGVAKTAAKLSTVSMTAWGQTYWTSGGVPTSISGDMTDVGNVTLKNGYFIRALGPDSTARNIIGFSSSGMLYIGNGTISPKYLTRVYGWGIQLRYGFTDTSGAAKNGLGLSIEEETGAVGINKTLAVGGATTLTGLLTANGNIVTGTSDGAYIQIGAIKLVYDSTNNALKVVKSDNTSANLYATGAVSALGANSSGGGGGGDFSEAQMWAALQGNTGTYANEKINANHIPDTSSLYGYLKASSLSGYVNAVSTTGSGNAVTSVTKSGNTITFTKGSTFLTSHQTLYTLSVYGGTTKVLDFKPNANASLYIKAGGDISLTNDTTNKYITLSYTHPTNGANTTISAANGKVLSAITVNSLGHVTSVSSKTLAAADIPDLSSTYATAARATTLESYFTSDVAKKAAADSNGRSLVTYKEYTGTFPPNDGTLQWYTVLSFVNQSRSKSAIVEISTRRATATILIQFYNTNAPFITFLGYHGFPSSATGGFTGGVRVIADGNNAKIQFQFYAATSATSSYRSLGVKVYSEVPEYWVLSDSLVADTETYESFLAEVYATKNCFTGGGLMPTTDNSYNIGSSSFKYKNVYATNFYGALNGNASSATKLQTARTLWGQSFDGTANVSGNMTDVGSITPSANGNNLGTSSARFNIYGTGGNFSGALSVTGATTLTGLLTANGNIVTGTSNGAYIQIGAIKMVYDSTNNALKVVKSDNTSANLYATGAVSALGANSSGGGGGDFSEEQMWAALQGNTGTYADEKINANHIPDTSSLYGYLKSSALSGYVTSVKVGTTAYNPSSGVVSLPAYPTSLPASDVYSWAKASTKPSYTLDEVSDGSTRKLANYLPLAGGTLTGGLAIKFGTDSSQALGYNWLNTSGTSVASITYHNTAQNIILNPVGSSNTWSDAVGKYSLFIGNNKLTYNTYTILHSNNTYVSSGKGYINGTEITTISGNAATATKATQDGSGNTITSTYLKLVSSSDVSLTNSVGAAWGWNFANTYNSQTNSICYIGHANCFGMHIKSNTTSSAVYILQLYNSTKEIFGVYADGAINAAANINVNGVVTANQIQIQSGLDTKVIINNTDGEKYSMISFRESGTQYLSLVAQNNLLTLNGNLTVSGEVTASSDARKKSIISDTKFNVRDIASARSVLYEWNDGRDKYKKVHGGSIAQDWLGKADSFLNQDSDGFYSINYGALALCSAITIARMTINHEDRITMLERENAKLKARIAELEERRVA